MRQFINGITYIGDDVRVATLVGNRRTTKDLITGSTGYKQRVSQHGDYVSFLPLNSVGSSGLLLIDETELEPTGVGEIVEWDREYASIPPDRTEQGTAVKSYSSAQYLFTGGILAGGQLISYSATIKVDIFYHYFLSGTASTVPALPQANLWTIGPFFQYQAIGGFPTSSISSGGPTYTNAPTNNYAYCFISGEVTRWKGDIFQRRLVYG